MDFSTFMSQLDTKQLSLPGLNGNSLLSKLFGKKITSIEEYIFIHTNLFIRLSECTSPVSFVTAIHSYLRDMFGLSYAEFTRKYEKYVFSFMFLCLGVHLYRRPKTEGANIAYAQSATDKLTFKEVLQHIRLSLGKVEQIKNSDFIKKFGTFCSLVICTPFFVKAGVDSTWFGFSDIYHKQLKKEYRGTHSAHVALHIIDGATYITEKVILYLETGDYQCIFIDDAEIVAYEKDFEFLSYYSDKFALLANHEMTLDEYRRKVDKTIELGKKLMNFYSNDRYRKSLLKTQQASLARFKFRVDDKLCIASERKAPLSFCIFSPPCVGKSALTDKILHCLYENDIFLGEAKKPYDPIVKYMFNEDDEYMSEFKASHEVCVMDDVGQFNDDINLQKKGGSISKSIYFANTMPYMTNQAALEDKGMIPFTCRYIMKTTNIFDGGISTVFKDCGGAYRRDIFIEATVREEYRRKGEQSLDGDNSEDGFKNHELHVFAVRKYKVLSTKSEPVYWNNTEQKWCPNRSDDSLMTFAELSKFLLYQIQKPHYARNDVAKNSVEHFLASRFCKKCEVPSALCECAEAQHAEDTWESQTLDSIGMKPFVDKVSSFLTLWAMVCLVFCWIGHCIISRTWDNSKPNYFTRKVVQHVRNLPSSYCIPWWFKYIPMCIASRCFCEGWHTWSYDVCKKAYGFGSLMQARKHELAHYHSKYRVAGFIAMLGSFYLIMKLYIEATAQSKPEVDDKQAESNYWKASFQPISRLSGPTATVTMEQLSNRIEMNCCHLMTYVPAINKRYRICGLGIYGDIMALPKHYFDVLCPHFPLTCDIIRNDVSDTAGPSRIGLEIDQTCFFLPNGYKKDDLIYFKHPSLGSFRDLRKFILDKPFVGKCPGQILARDEVGSMNIKKFEALSQNTLVYKDSLQHHSFPGYIGYAKEQTIVGECGAPYLVQTMNGCAIAGIHVAGKPATFSSHYLVYCMRIYGWDFDPKSFVPLSYNGVDLNEHYETVEDLTIASAQDAKCPVRLTKGGTMMLYGKINTHRRKMKSAVCHTLMAERVLVHYDKLDFTHFSPKTVNSRIACKNNVEPMFIKPTFSNANIRRAEDALYEWYSKMINKHHFILPTGPYDIDVGVNGFDGASYIDRIPVSTSGGFAHKGAKKKYLTLADPEEGHAVRYVMNDEILREYSRLVQKYKSGQRGEIVWDFNFKDEPISESKVLKDKCRIFNSGPLHFMVLVRQYFLWCIPLFSGKHRHDFGMAIGANAHGDDWTRIYEHVTRHGTDRMIAGDYKAFDKNMPPELMTAAFNVLIRICKDNNWSDEDIMILRGIATDTCYPLSNVFGTIIGMFGSNPSGHPLTTPINGMCNIMYMMLAAMDVEEDLGICEIDYSNFLDHFSLVTYGDDNCASSKHDWLNHTSISTALAKRGVTYTMADKESESVPFIDISQVDFLKRGFVPDVIKKGVVSAPLDEASILKSLTVCTKSRTITFKEQCAQIIESAAREYFQYGRDKCLSEHKFLNSILDEFELRPYLPTGEIKTYGEMFLERFGHADTCP